jgi:hypothetical protein
MIQDARSHEIKITDTPYVQFSSNFITMDITEKI